MSKYAVLQSEEQTQEAIPEKLRSLERRLLVSVIFFMMIVIAGVTTFTVLYLKEHNDNKIQRKSMENEHRRRMDSHLSTMENLRKELKTINKFRDEVTTIQGDIVHIFNTLSRHNYSLDALSMDIKSVVQKLVSMQNSTTKEIQQLRGELDSAKESLRDTQNKIAQSNRTHYVALKEIGTSRKTVKGKVHIFNTLSKRNLSFHSTEQDASEALSMEIKSVEQKLISIHNSTTRELQQLRDELDNTSLNTESNKSHYSALEIIDSSLHSSLRNVNGTIVNLCTVKTDRLK